MTPRFERMALAGVGLIGGSLALAAREAGLVGEVVGLGRTQANLDVALQRSIIDRSAHDPAEAARGADLVVLAVPVGAIAAVAAAMGPSLGPKTVVTDVGSVKARVLRDVAAVLRDPSRFVGGHPIAGTEESGAAAARADLFTGTRCVLTPTERTDAAALEAVRGLWEGVGAEVSTLSPAQHDEILAWVSHVPHVLAYALMSSCPTGAEAYAGPSFRDATRVAASAAEMWRDIALHNAAAIDAAIEDLTACLEEIRAAVRRGDGPELAEIFARARARRRRLDGRE